MVSTIGAATSNISFGGPAYDQTRMNFNTPPHMIRDFKNSSMKDGNAIEIGTSLGRSGRRHPPSSSSTISSVTVNGKSYHEPVFDDRGNKLN